MCWIRESRLRTICTFCYTFFHKLTKTKTVPMTDIIYVQNSFSLCYRRLWRRTYIIYLISEKSLTCNFILYYIFRVTVAQLRMLLKTTCSIHQSEWATSVGTLRYFWLVRPACQSTGTVLTTPSHKSEQTLWQCLTFPSLTGKSNTELTGNLLRRHQSVCFLSTRQLKRWPMSVRTIRWNFKVTKRLTLE